jgi:hypothetical protein
MGGLEDLFYAYSFPPFDGRTLAMGIVLLSTGLNRAKSAIPLNRPGKISSEVWSPQLTEICTSICDGAGSVRQHSFFQLTVLAIEYRRDDSKFNKTRLQIPPHLTHPQEAL